ncbi:hypothetical protein SAMN05421858_4803 [Haladaptatus litoreus]|uniref:Uncharacterized protein n=1 Tax=Haladaptatus litoreus TaxID=553468 RepID=A0A1N7F808_9EURY|nr:hypothetical protein SAMN05421858_4803 [Haladaptatus litoreus]
MEDVGETVMYLQKRTNGGWNGTSTAVHTKQREIDYSQLRENIAVSSPTPIRERSIADEVLR